MATRSTIPLRPERVVLRETVAAFKGYGILLRRQNTGLIMVADKGGKRRPFRAGEAGAPDLNGVLPGSGRAVGIEVKREGCRSM